VGLLVARRGYETADGRDQSCPVRRLDLEPQRTGPRGTLYILRAQFVSVDDEWNQAALRILPKSFRQIERAHQSGTIERCCNDCRALLEDIRDVDVLACNRRHPVPRLREELSVSLIPHTTRFNQQHERLRVTVTGMPGCGHAPEPAW